MFKVSTMTMTMTMTFSSFVLRSSSFQVFKFQVPSFRTCPRDSRFFTLHFKDSSLFTLHSSLFTLHFRTAKLRRISDANTSYDTLTCTYDTLMIYLRAVTCN